MSADVRDCLPDGALLRSLEAIVELEAFGYASVEVTGGNRGPREIGAAVWSLWAGLGGACGLIQVLSSLMPGQRCLGGEGGREGQRVSCSSQHRLFFGSSAAEQSGESATNWSSSLAVIYSKFGGPRACSSTVYDTNRAPRAAGVFMRRSSGVGAPSY